MPFTGERYSLISAAALFRFVAIPIDWKKSVFLMLSGTPSSGFIPFRNCSTVRSYALRIFSSWSSIFHIDVYRLPGVYLHSAFSGSRLSPEWVEPWIALTSSLGYLPGFTFSGNSRSDHPLGL